MAKPPETAPEAPETKEAASEAKKPDPLADLQHRLLGLMLAEGKKFLSGTTKEDVAQLGEDAVVAIFEQQVIHTIAAIPGVRGGSLAERVALEEILASRSTQFQLIAKAEKEQAQRVARVRGNAVSAAGAVAKSILGVLGGVALSLLRGASL